MRSIFEKLARCSSTGEVKRMLKGNASVIVRADDLQEALKLIAEHKDFKDWNSKTTPDWYIRVATVVASNF